MLRVGLIGCGFMGTMHANCYKNLEDVELVAFADLRREKAEELAKGTNAALYSDGKDLIENAEVDVIDICLPTYLHAEYALLAMEKVKYVFVEKPVTLTVRESKALLKKQAETGAEVQVGQVIRFWDEYVALKNILDEGKYGKVVNANFRRLSPRPTWGWNNWLLDTALSGGAGSELGTGGMATKIRAARIATDAGCDMIITNGAYPERLYDIVDGLDVGTRFYARKR